LSSATLETLHKGMPSAHGKGIPEASGEDRASDNERRTARTCTKQTIVT